VQSSYVLVSVVCVALACSESFPVNVRVMMSIVHMTAWAYHLPVEWIGMPPAIGMDKSPPDSRVDKPH
jgi:hypothetical protein